MRDSMPRLIPVPDRPPIPAPTLYGPGTAGVPRTRPSDRSVSLMWPVVRVLIRMCSSKSSGTSGCRNLSPGHSQNLVHQIRHSREQSGCKCCQRHLRGQAARPRNAIRVAMDGDERRARNLQEQRRNREKAAADKAQKQAADRERQQRSRAANRGAANPSAADGPGGTGIGASAVASAVAVAPWASAALPPGNLHATDDRERELSETLTLSDSGHGAGGGTTRAAAGAAATSSASISAPSGDKPGTIVSGAVCFG